MLTALCTFYQTPQATSSSLNSFQGLVLGRSHSSATTRSHRLLRTIYLWLSSSTKETLLPFLSDTPNTTLDIIHLLSSRTVTIVSKQFPVLTGICHWDQLHKLSCLQPLPVIASYRAISVLSKVPCSVEREKHLSSSKVQRVLNRQ